MDKIPKDAKKFYTLKEFNNIYSADIKPIKNCYYVSNYNWDNPYIFWFNLESNKYIKQYWTGYYTYPKYDLPNDEIICFGTTESCIDSIKVKFTNIISNPCKD